MQNIPFIFSDRLHYRFARHFVFWLVAIFGLGAVGVGMRPLFNIKVGGNMFVENIFQPILYLPGQLLLVYTLLYFVIPRYVLKTKYRQALVWSIGLTILSGFIAALSFSLFDGAFAAHFLHRLELIIPDKKEDGLFEIVYSRLPFDFLFGLRSVAGIAGFAAAIKLMKYWYEKEYLNTILQREKLDAELQSLKAQIHPHFLFNTLNNIYSIAEETSPVATDMLLKLSGLLRYILYECDRPLVPLTQEFKLMEDYIALEKVRYKDLDLHLKLEKNCNHYSIAPLLILPLVENCFKHGTSRMLEQPWVKIQADIVEENLMIKLINGKPLRDEKNNFEYGIGLGNVKKRLDLLYPARHELTIISEMDVFIVNLKIQLHKDQARNVSNE